jgi:hypothetical protein
MENPPKWDPRLFSDLLKPVADGLKANLPWKQIRAAAEKIGETVQRATGYEGIDSEQWQKMLGDMKRWLEKAAPEIPGRCLNGTGLLFSDRWPSVPLPLEASVALQGMIQHGFHQQHKTSPLATASDATWRDATGAAHTLLLSSPASALSLIHAIHGGRSIWSIDDTYFVHPATSCHAFDPRPTLRALPADTTPPSASNGQSSHRNLLELRDASPIAMRGPSTLTPLAGVKVIEYCPTATLFPIESLSGWAPTIASRFQSGVDFLILPANGLLGGPPATLLLSRESHLELQSMASSLGLEAPEPLLGLWRSIQPSLTNPAHYRTTPMGQILGNPKENLEDRARRLLPRLAVVADLKAVDSDQRPCPIGSGLWASLTLPSTVLHFHPRTGDLGSLKERLQQMTVPIIASDDPAIAQSGSLAIVLRTILPEEDILLANQLRGTGDEGPARQVEVDL